MFSTGLDCGSMTIDRILRRDRREPPQSWPSNLSCGNLDGCGNFHVVPEDMGKIALQHLQNVGLCDYVHVCSIDEVAHPLGCLGGNSVARGIGGSISGAAGDLGSSFMYLSGNAISPEGCGVDGVVEHSVEAVCQLVQLLLGRPILLDVASLARLSHKSIAFSGLHSCP